MSSNAPKDSKTFTVDGLTTKAGPKSITVTTPRELVAMARQHRGHSFTEKTAKVTARDVIRLARERAIAARSAELAKEARLRAAAKPG